MLLILVYIFFIIGVILLLLDLVLISSNNNYKKDNPKEYSENYKKITDSKFYRGFRLFFYVELFFALIGVPFIIFFFLGYILFGILFNDLSVANNYLYLGFLIIDILFVTYMINRVRLRYLLNNMFNK